jgi:ABC-type phosphate transport system substrate-binding protein
LNEPGVKDFAANTVQFAGSDAPLKPGDQSLAESQNGSPALEAP